MKIFILISILVVAGCASNPTQKTALLLIDQIDEYEAVINKKISVEQTFYREIRAALKDTAGRQAWVEQKFATRNRITQLTDRVLVQDKGFQLSVLQQFLREENTRAHTLRAEEINRRLELESNYLVSFDSLTFRQRQLSSTRSRLLTLTQDQSVKEQLIKRINEAAKLARTMKQNTDAISE